MSGNGGNPHSLRDLLGNYEKSGLAVLSSGMEAVRIAAYAITPDGGYSDVSVHPSSLEPTHSSFCNWINGLQ